MTAEHTIPKTYDPASVEKKWYQYWEENHLFHAEPEPAKKPFTIVIPPPNITGQLHMGHALDNTLQDILIRWHRMLGDNNINLNIKIMARESVKILQGKLDVESLISQLNAALAEEWLAYYQYWVGALVVEGAMRADVQSEFEEHAEEERRHAQLLANRIIELEGVPVLDPQKWFELARCKYDAPQEFDSVSLLKDNVASERCAIIRYQEIADFTNGKDFTTCDIAKHILAEEEEHEQDLQDYLTDIVRMKKSFLEK